MTRREFNEGVLINVRRNRIFAVLHDDSNELSFYSDNAPCRFIVPEALTERQVKILLTQPKRVLQRM